LPYLNTIELSRSAITRKKTNKQISNK
jgi:hypothetical protein